MKQRILVIGGLAAGPSAAAKAKRVNPDAEVILFEQGEFVSYGICEVPYYVGNVITDPEDLIVYSPQKLEQHKGVKAMIFSNVEEISPVKKQIVVRDLYRDKIQEYTYDKLVISTGSHSRKLGLTGETARNVFHVKTLDQGYALKRFMEQEKPSSAVIIGGGYIGMEMAEALMGNGVETTLLHRSVLPMSGLEMETRSTVFDELMKHGVRFVPTSQVRELRVNSTGKVFEVVASTGTYPTDLVVLSLGVEPEVQLAKSARISLGPHQGILTDQRQSTNIDTIFAAGDCCQVRNLVTNRWMYIPLATIASKQAWVAGENAAGGSAVFKGAIRAIAVKVFDLEVAQVGISSDEAKEAGFDVVSEQITGNSKVGYFPGNAKVTIIAIADKKSRRLLGANVFGGNGAVLRANTLGVAIQEKLNVDEIGQLDLIYTPPFSPMWDPILIAANQLRKRLQSSGGR